MKFWNKYCALSRLRQIAIAVLLLHVLCIGILALFATPHKSKTHIAVRTVRPPSAQSIASPPQPAPKSATSQSKAATPSPPQPAKKSPAPSSTQSAKKSPTPKQTKSANSAKPSETPPPRKEASLLQEIASSLEELQTVQKTAPKQNLSLPTAVSKSISVEDPAPSHASYSETLLAFLQNALELPEYGEVKVALSIEGDGHLAHCHIVASRSQKNSDFLMQQLPELIFPETDDRQGISFTIVFKN